MPVMRAWGFMTHSLRAAARATSALTSSYTALRLVYRGTCTKSQLALMPARWMMSRYFLISPAMMVRSSSGVDGVSVRPCAV